MVGLQPPVGGATKGVFLHILDEPHGHTDA